MKKLLLFTLPLLAISASAADSQTGIGETDGYKLVWQDLFDDGVLNPERWLIEVNGDGGGNNELQYYTDRPENVSIQTDADGNSCLVLTARRESYKGKSFTSGRVISRDRVTFLYGRLEASIKLPATANGLWPAFWTMGNDITQVGWPKCGEIDIMEFGHSTGIKNGTQDRFFNGACHWGTAWNATGDYAKDATWPYSLQDGNFHTFTMEWTPERISMYCDRDRNPKPYYEMTIPKTSNQRDPGYYFHKLNFILFNLAVGGNFPGIHNAAGITALNDQNGQQASMMINYVKLYQKPDNGSDLFTLVPGDPAQSGIDDIAADQSAMTVNGNEITLARRGDIEVFNIAGSRVAAVYDGHALSLGHLPAGLYIVRASVAGRQAVTKIRK